MEKPRANRDAKEEKEMTGNVRYVRVCACVSYGENVLVFGSFKHGLSNG